MRIKKFGLATSTVLAIVLLGTPALALGASNAHANAATAQASTRLAEAQLRACQNREKAINTILTRIVTRGQNHLTLFSTIADRVEAFKTAKNVTVSNYDQLVAKLTADKDAATADLSAMKANGTLDCSSADPKGMVTAFQSDLKKEIGDLQTYRTDVKNLIVAVKTALGSSTSDTTKTTTGGNQ